MKLPILIIVLFLSLTSCKKAEEEYDSKIEAIALPPKAKIDQVKFVQPVVANADQNSRPIAPKIIKEGNLRFETSDLNATYQHIVKSTTESGGSIQNDVEGKDYGSIFRKLVIRIPSQNFDPFLIKISKGVTYFDNKEITAEDVTAQYIDLDARLKAKKTLENRYLELLKKATKVTEMLEIETQLSAIREEIEAKQAEMNYLQGRVAQSTIHIEFYKNVAVDSGVTISYGTKIWNAITSGFNSLSGLFIWLLSFWPFAILASGLVYFIRKKIKTKKTK